jgi:effector-binding domain-containing protein
MNKTKQRIKVLEMNIEEEESDLINNFFNEIKTLVKHTNSISTTQAKLQATKQTLKEVEEIIDEFDFYKLVTFGCEGNLEGDDKLTAEEETNNYFRYKLKKELGLIENE